MKETKSDVFIMQDGKGFNFLYKEGENLRASIANNPDAHFQCRGRRETLEAMGFKKVHDEPRLNMMICVEFQSVECFQGDLHWGNFFFPNVMIVMEEKGSSDILDVMIPREFFTSVEWDYVNKRGTVRTDLGEDEIVKLIDKLNSDRIDCAKNSIFGFDVELK